MRKLVDLLSHRMTLRIIILIDVILGTLYNYTKLDTSFLFYITCGISVFIFCRDFIEKRVNYKKFPNNILLIILFIFLVSNIWNYRFSTIYSYVRMFEMFNYMIALGIVDNKENKKHLESFYLFVTKFIFVFTLLMTTLSFILLFIQQNLGVNIPIILIFSNRFFSLFNNPNILAVWAFISVLMSIILFVRFPKYKYIYISNVIVQVIAILLADCRAVYIMIALCTIVIPWYLLKKKNFKFNKKYIILFIGIVLFAIFVAGQTSLGHINDFSIPKALSALTKGDYEELLKLLNSFSSERIVLWLGAFCCFLKSPLLGVGLSNINQAVVTYFGNRFDLYYTYHYEDPHGLIFSILGYTGIIGFIAFAVLFIKHFLSCFKFISNNKNFEFFILVLLQLSMLVYAFFDIAVVFDGRIQAYVFWFLMGYLSYKMNLNSHTAEEV